MTIKELYGALGGDYEEALRRLMNDVLITRFLSKFADYEIEPLQKAMSENDAHGVFLACHALKGVAGNLALTRLFDLSSALAEKTRGAEEGAKMDVQKDAEEVIAEFRKEAALIKENVK